MAIRLKQSTASQEVPLGPFLDDTDGKTAETALTIANTDIKVWKNGATTLANKNSGGATHISGGIYYAVLDATDTNTLGPLVIFVQVAGALPVRVECEVLAANVFDSLVGGGDTLDVQVTGIGSGVITATAIASNAITSAKVATDAIGAAQLAADAIGSSQLAASAVTEIQSGLSTLDAAGVRTALGMASANLDTQLTAIDDAVDTEVAAILAAVDTEVAAIKAKTDNLPASPANEATLTTIAGYIDTEVASILAAVDTEVAAIKAKTDNLPASPANEATLTTIAGYIDTEVAAIKAKTDNLPASPAATGDIPSAATIADAVWDEAIADHIGAGAAGLSLINAETYAANVSLNFDLLLGTLMLEWGTLTGATSTTANTGGLLADDAPVGALLVITGGTGVGQVRRITDYVSATGVATVSPAWTITPDSTSDYSILADADSSAGSLTAAAIADAVWDELVADHTGVGSTGEALGAAGGGVTAAAIADAVWDEALSGHVTAGSAGKALGDIDTDTSAILVDTGTDIPASITALNDLDAAGVRAAVGLAAANLDTQLAAIDDAVDTEVASILAAVDTEVAAIKAKTDNLPASPANEATLTTIAGYIDTEVAAIKAKTDLLPASPAATGDIPTVDQIWAKAMTELAAVPGVTGTVLEALEWLFTLARNKRTQTDTTETVFKDDGLTTLATSSKSDDGSTFTRGEYS